MGSISRSGKYTQSSFLDPMDLELLDVIFIKTKSGVLYKLVYTPRKKND